MGAALEASGRDIVYSCSWPAYTGANESTKPFAEYIMDGCNLWRNYVSPKKTLIDLKNDFFFVSGRYPM